MLTDREDPSDSGADQPRKPFPALLGCFVALLAAETLALVALVVWAVMQTAQARASDVAGDVALLIITALGVVWLALMTVGAARRRSWIRASSVTWHLVLFAVAVGCFTGVTAVPAVGWWLLLVAVVGIGLVVTPSVTRATAREMRRDDDAGETS